MKVLQAFLVLGLLFGLLLVPGAVGPSALSPARAETPPYRYCMVGTPNIGRDCLYSTLQQCQVAASAGVGFCEENAFYLVRRPTAPAPKHRGSAARQAHRP